MSKIAAYTLGCKVNQYDTEGVLSHFKQNGYEIVAFSHPADIYLINTCTVTAESDKKSRQIIRRAREHNPEAVIVVMGCYAQTAIEEVKKIPGVDVIIGTSNRDQLVKLVEEYQTDHKKRILVTDPEVFEDLKATYHERTRAYIKIEDGCENYCSYCKIPYARGKIRSKAPESVLDEVKSLADTGVKEVIFTGIHLGYYGRDLLGWNLAKILKATLKIPGIRVRLSSLDPHEVDEEIIELLEEPSFCRHLHIPLQSGTDKILHAMNRNYDTAYYRSLIERLQKYSPLGLTTDVIVGFPTETEEDFLKTCAFVQEMKFTRLHVFPFSRRKGTKAYFLPDQLPRVEKQRRAKELIAIGNKLMLSYHKSQIGRLAQVVVEQETKLAGKSYYLGTTEDYIKVHVPKSKPSSGLAQVKLDKVYASGMLGCLLETV